MIYNREINYLKANKLFQNRLGEQLVKGRKYD